MLTSLSFLLFPILALAAPTTLDTRQVSNAKYSAASQKVTSQAGLAWYSSSLNNGAAAKSDPSSYTCYSGPASNFPPMSSWTSFNAMWSIMAADALTPIGDSPKEQKLMLQAIKTVSKQAKVDPRIILAVIVGEVSLLSIILIDRALTST